jgi:hypothetical protein
MPSRTITSAREDPRLRRARQSQSSATHAAGHLQLVGVGDWKPTSTRPGWSDDPRVAGDTED